MDNCIHIHFTSVTTVGKTISFFAGEEQMGKHPSIAPLRGQYPLLGKEMPLPLKDNHVLHRAQDVT